MPVGDHGKVVGCSLIHLYPAQVDPSWQAATTWVNTGDLRTSLQDIPPTAAKGKVNRNDISPLESTLTRQEKITLTDKMPQCSYEGGRIVKILMDVDAKVYFAEFIS